MGLRTKFNLILISAFVIGLAVATLIAWQVTAEEAKRQMLNEANLMMRSGTAVRGYTQNEIRPLIADQLTVRFLPHSVPSWSAQTVLHALKQPLAFVSVSVRVNVLEEPAVTVTDWALVAPLIEPLPLMLQR